MVVSTGSPILMNVGQGLSIMLGLPKLKSWKTKERPKVVTRGIFGFNSQTNSLEYFDGSSWFAAPLSKS